MIKKNLFIFKEYPEIFSVDDSYLIIGSQENFNKLDLNDFDNVFTIFYTPIWLKRLLNDNQVNIVQLNEEGKILKTHLHHRVYPTDDRFLGMENRFLLLKLKAKTIDNLFKTKEAESLLNYAFQRKVNPYLVNESLNFFVKAAIMDILKLNYKLTNKRAKEITNTLFNLTTYIVSYSFYNKFLEEEINPENGFLNIESPSLIRDLTEIQRLRFLKKLHYLFKSRFFEGKDLNRKHFPDTTVKFLKILSTYFFYSNRFKRSRELFYLMECYKRGKIHEIFSCV